MEKLSEMLKIGQVARELGISECLVRKHVRNGRLRAYNFGGGRFETLRFARTDVNAFKAGAVVQPLVEQSTASALDLPPGMDLVI